MGTADWSVFKIGAVNENGAYFPDFPQMGWNNDAIAVSFNMFPNGRSFKQVQVLSINKATAEDANSSTFTYYRSDVSGGTTHFTLTP